MKLETFDIGVGRKCPICSGPLEGTVTVSLGVVEREALVAEFHKHRHVNLGPLENGYRTTLEVKVKAHIVRFTLNHACSAAGAENGTQQPETSAGIQPKPKRVNVKGE